MTLDTLLAAARLLHYAAAIQLFGLAIFHRLLVPAGLRPALQPRARRIATLSALGLVVSGLSWLMLAAAGMGDGLPDALNPDVLGTVLGHTAFGRAWGPHLIVCALALVAAMTPAGWVPLTLLSAVALGSLGLVGHAAIGTGLTGLLSIASQVLHLLSSGFWLGALLPLLFLLPMFRDRARQTDAELALRRFSGLGHFAVAVLLLSGVANSWFVLGARIDLAAPYQQLLLLKIGIAGTMCGLAIVNRYVFMPRIPHGGPGARQLGQGTIAEIVLSGAILLLVSVIGMLSPA